MPIDPSPLPVAIRASVCMATYRGVRYVAEQLESILAQLADNDEVVIVDDASGDATVEIVKALDDPRVRIIEVTTNQGYVRSFEQAVLASTGKFIFLADQDDVWIPGRLELMLTALQSSSVVASNFAVLGGGSRGNVPELKSGDSNHHLRNIFGTVVGYRPYYGCGMAMTRQQAEIFAPVPPYLRESHDLWLALCGNVAKSMVHLDEPTLLRRLHDENVTPRGWRSLSAILRARIMIVRAFAEAVRRTKNASKRLP
ncbi:glycosyl transferase [Arthrobacter alpinus]|nr:glycosyl transferase [Arthrobacter alpinus]